MQKRWAITDLNVPNGSRDIPSRSQESGQDGRRHFLGFQPHFHVNMTSQTQSYKTMKKWKCNISGVFCSIHFKFCRLLDLSKGISFDFKFVAHIYRKLSLKTYKMATPILLKFLTLGWDISRTIWRIEVSDGSSVFAFFALYYLSLTYFSTGGSL